MNNRPWTPQQRADSDAFFMRLQQEIVEHELRRLSHTTKKPAPKDSGDPADGPSCVPEGPVALIPGALNANLTPVQRGFEFFVSDVCHKQHPKCD